MTAVPSPRVPFAPPAARSWIQVHYPHPTYLGSTLYDDGRATARWHWFTGDMRWAARWDGHALITACGHTSGPIDASFVRVVAVDDPPPDACANCLRVMSRS